MNAEQLNSARLARWSQNGEARLTLDAAAQWVGDIGYCPYMTAGLNGSAPAPSFLEAVVGRPAPAPSLGERARALELLARLIENSSVVPLKLGLSLGEQPDFVCSPDVLRYIYALRGDRNFKTGPLTVGNEKVTPLSLHCWQAIEQQGPLDVAALQPILGRDITEAAIARALQELWSGLYIFPLLRAGGEASQWELLFRRFPKPVAAGASIGHAEAQSAMISLYLQASVAVREEEILAFLSPLAPQSKLRQAIRGLGSMRQLDIIDIGGRAHVALQGGLLPEMVAQLSEEQLAPASTPGDVAGEPEIAMEAEIESEREVDMNAGIEMDSGIEIEALPEPAPRAWRSQPMEVPDGSAPSAIRKFTPKKIVPRQGESKPPRSERFAARGSGEKRAPRRPFSAGSRSNAGGFSPPAGAYAPGSRSYPAGSFAAGAEESRSVGRPRPSGPRHSGPGRFGAPSFRRDRDAGPSRGPASHESFSRDRAERGAKPQERKGHAAKGHGMGERAKRWKKAGDVQQEPSSGGRPSAPRSAGFKTSGFQPAGSKFRGAKRFGSNAPGSKFGGAKPWQSRSSSGEGREERPKPWKKFDGAGDSRSDARGGAGKPYASKSSGFKPRGAKPWAGKSSDGEESSARRDRPSGARGMGPGGGERPSGRTPQAPKPSGFKTKGAGSRVGSAKSYAARSAAKPYAKADGAKPWARRPAASAEGEGKRKRREPKEAPETSPREKSGAKPFWAKNPRGGKGSTAASRSNRPRGMKPVRKGGKRK